MATTPLPVGYTNAITLFGDSLTAGTGSGGRDIGTILATYYPERIVTNQGIGGQTAEQIAARQGGTPATLNVSGGSTAAAYAPTSVTPSVNLGSTAADNNTRYISGMVAGQHVTVTRTATGTAPSQVESYTITNAGNTVAVAVPTWAPFIPDQGHNARDELQVIWLGRNNVGNPAGAQPLSAVPGLVDSCVQFIRDPRRYIVIGVMPSTTDITGSANGTAIAAVNATMATAYGDQFIPTTPPTTAEMTAVGYTPTTQDTTDISNGVWPTGLHATSDTVHLNGQGYAIMANRIRAVIAAKGW